MTSEDVLAPLSGEILGKLCREAGGYEAVTHTLLFALGRIMTVKEPDLDRLELELIDFMTSLDISAVAMMGAGYQKRLGHHENGGMKLEGGADAGSPERERLVVQAARAFVLFQEGRWEGKGRQFYLDLRRAVLDLEDA